MNASGMSNGATPPGPTAESPLSEGERLINTFVAPAKTFSDLRRKPAWLVPWLLLAVAHVIMALVVGQRVGFERLARTAIESSPQAAKQLEQLPAADREQRTTMVSKSIQYTFYASPVIILVAGLIMAAVLMGIFNFMASEKFSFGASMGVVMYSFLPTLIATGIIVVSLYLGDPEGFNLDNPTATNLGALLDPATTSKFVYIMAKAVDLFNIWVMLLMGIGYAAVGRMRRQTTWGTLFGLYLLIKLISAGWAQLFA
jgi:hypothetical protein